MFILKSTNTTEHLPIQRMPFVSRYIIPLSQHLGAPAKAIVKEGQRVERGEVIAEPGGFVSIPHHSPVTGWVRAVAPRRHANGQLMPAIEIEADPYATQRFEPRTTYRLAFTLEQGVRRRSAKGRLGRNGRCGLPFTRQVRRARRGNRQGPGRQRKRVRTFPHLRPPHHGGAAGSRPSRNRGGARKDRRRESRHRRRDEQARCRRNTPTAYRAGAPIEVVPVKVKYPQGAEKMLINAIFKVEVPAGKLPIDIGMVVNNVGTMAALADYLDTGMPLIERVVTVSGPGIKNPANLIVPLGTPVRDVLDFAVASPKTREIILGGPMMGKPTSSLDVPVMKGNSGILAFTETETSRPEEWACVRCGRCAEACPYFLNPSLLGRLSRARRYDDAERIFVMDCMECGSCTFACPSSIPLVQLIRVAKSEIRNKKARTG